MPRFTLEGPRLCTIFCIPLLCMNYVTSTFLLVSSSVRSKQLLCLCTAKAENANKNLQQTTLSGFITVPLYYLGINSIHIWKASLFPEKEQKKFQTFLKNCLVSKLLPPNIPRTALISRANVYGNRASINEARRVTNGVSRKTCPLPSSLLNILICYQLFSYHGEVLFTYFLQFESINQTSQAILTLGKTLKAKRLIKQGNNLPFYSKMSLVAQ